MEDGKIETQVKKLSENERGKVRIRNFTLLLTSNFN